MIIHGDGAEFVSDVEVNNKDLDDVFLYNGRAPYQKPWYRVEEDRRLERSAAEFGVADSAEVGL